jgi:hypothetical protein
MRKKFERLIFGRAKILTKQYVEKRKKIMFPLTVILLILTFVSGGFVIYFLTNCGLADNRTLLAVICMFGLGILAGRGDLYLDGLEERAEIARRLEELTEDKTEEKLIAEPTE